MTDKIRQFETGATRDAGIDPATGLPKLAYYGFFSPQVMKRRAEYMNKHRVQSDGSLRAPDNWKKGIPKDVYLDSLLRHVMDLWLYTEGVEGIDKEETLCAIGFNVDGLLYETLKTRKREVNCKDCNSGCFMAGKIDRVPVWCGGFKP